MSKRRLRVVAVLPVLLVTLFVAQPAGAASIDDEPITNPSAPAFESASPDDVVAVSSSGEELTVGQITDMTTPDASSMPLMVEGSGRTEDLGVEGVDWSSEEPPLESLKQLKSESEPEGAAARTVIGDDSRSQYTNGDDLAVKKQAWIMQQSATGGLLGTCSGVLLKNDYVLTAGHCTYNYSLGAFYPYVEVFIGYTNTATGHAIMCSKTKSWAGYNYTQTADPNADWGLMKLSCSASNVNGYYNLLNPTVLGFNDTLSAKGYPSDKPEGTLWGAFGKVKIASNTRLAYDIDLESGQSGAAIFTSDPTPYIAGIHTLGTPNSLSSTFNAGVRMTSELTSSIGTITNN
jgi:glutamyl endopeptidase